MNTAKKGLTTVFSRLNSMAGDVATIKIRLAWLIILAVVLKMMVWFLGASSFVALNKTLLILSYVLLVWALFHNCHLYSIRLLLVGTLLNFVAIVANGGLMPVSPQARLQAGISPIEELGFGDMLSGGKGILLPIDETKLWFLSDIIPVSPVKCVFSLGDVLIGLGLMIFLVEATRRCGTGSRKVGATMSHSRPWSNFVKRTKRVESRADPPDYV